MSTTSRRRRRMPADRELRQEILAATEKLLEEQRFDELAVADILQAANVSRSSFYFYFESKHAVLAELVRTTFGEALEVTRPWLEHDPGDSPRTALELGARQGVKLWLDHAPVMRAAVESWPSDPELADLWFEVMENLAAAVAEGIEHDRQRGIAPATEADPRQLASLLVWMGERACYLASVEHPQFNDHDRLVHALVDVWDAVIYNRPS